MQARTILMVDLDPVFYWFIMKEFQDSSIRNSNIHYIKGLGPQSNHCDSRNYRETLRDPSRLYEQKVSSVVVIDEIQKLPELLDEVHRIIEEKGQIFLLTGSSARKLKRGGANLLAGRAWWADLFPLTSNEIPDFDLITYLNRGGLPDVYQSNLFQEELQAYTGLYLQEEIKNEAFTRNIAQFSEFLELVALGNGEELSYQSFANDCGVSANTIKNYVQLLFDTLVAFELQAFIKTRKRKAITRSKLYLFDIGVTNALARRGEIFEQSELIGKAFEQMIANYAIVSCDRTERTTADNIHIFPWHDFLQKLWVGRIL